MSKKTTLLLVVILEIIVLLMIGIAWQKAAAIYKQSLAAPIVLDVQPTPTGVMKPTNTTQPQIVPVVKTCGQSGVMTILYLARDKANGSWPYGADLIRFVRVDYDNKTIRLIAVPRDLWVETPHLVESLNLQQSRLGLVYFRVEQDSTGSPVEIATVSTKAVAQALYDNYGVQADHYIFFEMRYFVEAIDLIGGLDVNIPAYISSGETFNPGQQHLDGYHALYYARMLPGQEITEGWNRMDRQNLIMKALIAKMLEPVNLLKIPELYQQFKDEITTDLSPELIASLTCMAGKVPPDQITNVRVEQNMILGAGPDNSMIADTEKVQQFLQEQLAP